MCRVIGPGARVWLGSALLALFLEGGAALAAQYTVASSSGDNTTGSFRQIVGSAATRDTIGFAAGVLSIHLQDAALNTATGTLNLDITGGNGGPSGLDNKIKTLLLDYGIDVDNNKTDFDNTSVDLDDPDISNILKAAIAGLPRPSPSMTLDGEGGNYRLLQFESATAGTIRLTDLYFHDVLRVVTGTDDDQSGTTGGTTADADASVPDQVLDLPNKNVRGGALYINNQGALDYVTIAGARLEVTGGTATAGSATNSSGDANANANAYAYGGGAYFTGVGSITNSLFQGNYVKATGGTAIGGTANATNRATANAYAYAYAYGGGAYFTGVGNITNSLFQGNSAEAIGGTTTGGTASSSVSYAYARGGGDASDTTPNLPPSEAAQGGGAYFTGARSYIKNSLFLGNSAKATGGNPKGGDASTTAANHAFAIAYSKAYASGGGAYFKDANSYIENSLFLGNYAEATGRTAKGGTAFADFTTSADGIADAHAYGGGAYFDGTGSITGSRITGSLFQGNYAKAKGGTATSGTITRPDGPTGFLISTLAVASGGGTYFGGAGSYIENSLFQGNYAKAEGGTATGGIMPANTTIFNDYVSAYAYASGGGAYFNGNDNTITGSLFEGNHTEAIGGTQALGSIGGAWANADAYAFGGAVYLKGTTTITDSSFFDNRVTASATGTVSQNEVVRSPEAEARGGAIFVNASGANATLELEADTTDIELSGNTANGVPNSIHFGRGGNLSAISINPNVYNDYLDLGTGYFADSGEETTFTISATNHDIRLLDPVTVELYRQSTKMVDDGSGRIVEVPSLASFAMTVQAGSGTFFWGGTNVFDANGGASVMFANGSKTVFLDDFTLRASRDIQYRTGSATDAYARALDANNTNALKVTLENGTDFTFSYTRPTDLALFDFTGSTSENTDGSFVVEGGEDRATVSMVARREGLLGVPAARYLVADGVSENDGAAAAADIGLKAGDNIDYFVYENENEKSQVWAITKSYAPPPSYQLKIADWINLENAVPSLQDLLCDECGVTQEEFNVVAAHLDSATPDHIINQAVASFRLSETLHDTARDHASLETVKGTRLWGRFLGLSSDQMESHDRYRGYRQDANGFLLGLDHDVGSATAGAYVGYTRGRTTTRGGSSGEIETDGYHLGLLGRFSPWEDRPEFVLTGEAGYSRYASDAWRDVGLGWIRADFHQRVQSVGVGAEYELKSGDSRLTSFARLRQARLEQDGVEERGSVTRTRVDSVSGDRLSSELGMRFSRTFTTARSTATPYVSASWRHELGDTDFSTRARYALPEGSCLESPLPGFRLGSVAWDRNVARLGAGVHASLGLSQGRRLGINTDYKASVGHHGVSHAFSVLLELAF